MILPLSYYGNPILRKPSLKVQNINQEIKTLIQDMIETMDALQGVGLAAPQVGKSLKIFVLRPVVYDEKTTPKLGEVMVFINPILSNPSEQTEVMNEGCLSFPELHLEIERPLKIHVEALDLEGKPFQLDALGFLAREIMHENDHIHARLFIDHIKDSLLREEIKPILKKIKKEHHS